MPSSKLLFSLAVLALAACGGGANDVAPSIDAATKTEPAPTCGAHGAWLPSDGGSQCRCFTGYAGDACDHCAPGYSDSILKGSCAPPDVCSANPDYCSHHGTCQNGSPATCACDDGYAGAACGECADGFVADATGACQFVPKNCDEAGSEFCNHGSCSSSDSGPVCSCADGYSGTRCDQCAAGYDANGAGDCVPGCIKGAYTCSNHGACVDTDAGPACTCSDGYFAPDPLDCVPAHGLTCSDPIQFDLGIGYIESTTLGGSGSMVGSCAPQSIGFLGRVFLIHLPTAQRVRFQYEASEQSFETVVSIRSDCPVATSEVACEVGPPLEADLPAGDSYLIANTWNASDVAISAQVVCPDNEAFSWTAQSCVADPCQPNPCADDNKHACSMLADGTAQCACDPGYQVDASGACVINASAQGASCNDLVSLVPGRHLQVEVKASAPISSGGVASCTENGGSAEYFGLYLAQRSRLRFYAASDSNANYISLSLRSVCPDRTSEVACQSDGAELALGNGPGLLGGEFDAGDYSFIVDGIESTGEISLAYDVHPDPCAAMTPCAAGMQFERASDWSTCTCICPEGFVNDGNACIADPCAPNPCSAPTSRCVIDPGAQHHCECPVGNIADGAGCKDDPAMPEWTVIVYEDMDNNLDFAGPTGPQHLLVSSFGAQTPVNVVWLSATVVNDAPLYHVGNGDDLEQIEFWDTPDMGDWRTLRDLGLYAVEHYPAHHYALVPVDHGGTWEFSWDTGYEGNSISVTNGDYARALDAITREIGKPLDIIHFATCDMAAWEVAEATRPYALSMLASPEISYGNGSANLANHLAANPGMSVSELGHAEVDQFKASAMEIRSWIDLTGFAAVTADLNDLSTAMMSAPEDCGVFNSDETGCSPFEGYADIVEYATSLANDASLPPGIREKAATLASAVTASVYVQPSGTSGMSIYLPELSLPTNTPADQRGLIAGYQGAIWTTTSVWDDMLLTCRDQK